MTICKGEQNYIGECQIMNIHLKEEFLGEKMCHKLSTLVPKDNRCISSDGCNAGTWIRSLRQKDPLEKEMATYSSILA